MIIADGFSCREQIHQETDRHAMHLAEVMAMAIRNGPTGPVDRRPEEQIVRARRSEFRKAALTAGAYATVGAVAGAMLWNAMRKAPSRHA